MDRFLKAAAREEGWTQAPGVSLTPAKRKPGRPPDTEEKKKLRWEKKEHDAATKGKTLEQQARERAQEYKERQLVKERKKNEDNEALRTAVGLLCGALKDQNPEEAAKVQEILDKVGSVRDEGKGNIGKLGAASGATGAYAGKYTRGRSSKEKLEERQVSRKISRDEGLARRGA